MAMDRRIVDSTAFCYIDDAVNVLRRQELASHFYKTIMRHEYAYSEFANGTCKCMIVM